MIASARPHAQLAHIPSPACMHPLSRVHLLSAGLCFAGSFAWEL